MENRRAVVFASALGQQLTRQESSTFIGLAALFTAILAPYLVRQGLSLASGIYLTGMSTLVLASLIARVLDRSPRPPVATGQHPFVEWLLKRGILYLQLQTPLLALLLGVFLKLAPYGMMTLTIFTAFLTLPLWVAHRKAVSRDPDEPVHHLGRYALWALVPVPLFSVVRIPASLAFGQAFWGPWYEFGNALTGLPVNQLSSLAAGAFLYTLQGFSLTLGFFILFPRRKLLHALLYICVFDCAIYSFIFPAFLQIGMNTPPRWHAIAWGAHAVIACAAWYAPIFWERVKQLRLRTWAVTVAGIAILVGTPYLFAFRRAVAWQFPRQQRIDQELFARAHLLGPVGPTTVKPGLDENQYRVRFAFGPRTYRNYTGRLRALDVRSLEIQGRLRGPAGIVAWCRSSLLALENPNRFVADAREYPRKLQELDTVEIPLTCFGPPAASPGALTLEWESSARLVGERGETVRKDSSGAGASGWQLTTAVLR